MEILKRKNFYQALTIFIWLLFLLLILTTGKIQTYINRRFIPFTITGSLILFVLFLIKLKKMKKESTEKITLTSLLSFLIFLFPVLLTIIVKPGTLPALAVGRRGISQEFSGGDVMDVLKAQLEMEGNYKKLNIKQVLTLAKNKPEEINGKDISVEGFVFKDVSTEKFMLVRFLITCCAADATPLGIEVLYSNTEQLQQESWVKVYGKCTIKEGKVFITAEDVKETQKPSSVYLY